MKTAFFSAAPVHSSAKAVAGGALASASLFAWAAAAVLLCCIAVYLAHRLQVHPDLEPA